MMEKKENTCLFLCREERAKEREETKRHMKMLTETNKWLGIEGSGRFLQNNLFLGLEKGERSGTFLPFVKEFPPPSKPWTGKDLSKLFSKRVSIDRNLPASVAAQILPSIPTISSILDGKNVCLQIVCNPTEGFDQALVLALEFASFQAKARVIKKVNDFDPNIPVVVFFTDKFMEDNVARDIVSLLSE